jgi:tRNA dimethylallyltransferase
LRRTWEGQLTEDEGVTQTQQATRQFAKRQMTWFRKEAGVHWLSGFGDEPHIFSAALEIARKQDS